MALLGTDAYKYLLASSLAETRTSLALASAYITTDGINWILGQLSTSLASFRVLARWSCDDLVSGASDIEVYELLHARGASFYILTDLHAKVVLIDEQDLFVSSANITRNGLRLVSGGNYEIGVRLTATPEDIVIIESMFAEAVEVTPSLYSEIRECIERYRQLIKPQKRMQWPTTILQKLKKDPEYIWVTELPWCYSPELLRTSLGVHTADESAVRHDLILLGIDTELIGGIGMDVPREAFQRSRAWRWLISRLEEAETPELYFGRLSSILHEAILDDPKPYRQEIKVLVANLFKWAETLGQPTVVVDRPNHSQRIRLIQR